MTYVQKSDLSHLKLKNKQKVFQVSTSLLICECLALIILCVTGRGYGIIHCEQFMKADTKKRTLNSLLDIFFQSEIYEMC